MGARASAPVGYVLKGYPRISELFIASEIYRVEQAGQPLRLFVLKDPDETGPQHPLVEQISARLDYLPATTSLSKTSARRWLRKNLHGFAPSLRRVARRSPLGLGRACLLALAQSVRARKRFVSWPRKVYLRELLQAVALADRVLADPEIRHLHAHFAHGATTVTWLASAITGVPFSFTGHAKDIYEESLNPAGLLARKLRAACFAVTCTEANRTHLLAIEPRASIHRIYHGLNAELTRLVGNDAPNPRGNGHVHVLAVGRLVRKKGFDVLVRACGLLADRGVPLDVRIVGPASDHAPALERLIEELGLSGQIELIGSLSQDELYREYLRASVFCLPCRILDSGDRDGIPNVLVEAMACGVPVVSTSVSGIPELVEHDENGLLVEPDDPEAIAAAIVRLRDEPALAARLGEHARRTVEERFDGAELARTLTRLFEEAVT